MLHSTTLYFKLTTTVYLTDGVSSACGLGCLQGIQDSICLGRLVTLAGAIAADDPD